MADYVFVKSTAQSPVIPGEFTDSDNNPIDLSGKTITITMRPWNSSAYILDHQPATINGDPKAGKVYFALSSSDAIPGHHLAEWTINPGDLILPTTGYVHVIIDDSL